MSIHAAAKDVCSSVAEPAKVLMNGQLGNLLNQKPNGVTGMSIDKSLKKRGALLRARNVLKRHERIVKLQEQDRWGEEQQCPIGLPKVRVYRLVTRKAKKKTKEEEKK